MHWKMLCAAHCPGLQVMVALGWAVAANAHKGDELWRALELLSRLTSNIVRCGNSVEKYRWGT
jgi:hypothetical protein